ncbi:50S ribosomal protein L13 [Candidatus Roizmanbacteria bacterium]|nr:50S ribosomal protein L13 [Candidatus Roizmanbacteria bacterium]
MKNPTQQTKSVKAKEINRKWHLFDVKGKILGRMASEISQLLQGKNKVNYVSYLDMGDYVVVINAKKVAISGRKNKTKVYTNYSGYPGGLRMVTYEKLLEQNPGLIIKNAVSGMLPKNKFRDVRLNRLFIFADENHPYKNKFIKL